jgi:hypothetical protein
MGAAQIPSDPAMQRVHVQVARRDARVWARECLAWNTIPMPDGPVVIKYEERESLTSCGFRMLCSSIKREYSTLYILKKPKNSEGAHRASSAKNYYTEGQREK